MAGEVGLDEASYKSLDKVRLDRNMDTHGASDFTDQEKFDCVDQFEQAMATLSSQSSLSPNKNNFVTFCAIMKKNFNQP